MCFIVYSNKKLTANKNITCYKILEVVDEDSGMLLSQHREYVYFLGELNKLNKKLSIDGRGYYSTIHKGFHSYRNRNTVVYSENIIIFQCTIPKGTKYYKNSMEYVSDAIIINKRIN